MDKLLVSFWTHFRKLLPDMDPPAFIQRAVDRETLRRIQQ
jgi:hypothetical protein